MKNMRSGLAVSTILFLTLALTSVHAQTYTDLYNFGSNPGDPIQAQPANVVQGRDGNLYSSTEQGGTNGFGAIFTVTPNGELTVIYSFDSSTGMDPTGGLTLGTDGNLYGTAQYGGTFAVGILFKVTPTGTLTVLHDFSGGDGSFPYAPPVQGIDGNFYGTTTLGGTNGDGTVYQMTVSGSFTTLHSFDSTDGNGPYSALVQGTNGSLYGTTIGGGTNQMGTVFKISTKGQFATLHSFNSTDGSSPGTPLVEGNDGRFYGTTPRGGAHTNGEVFRISSTGQLTVLYSFPVDGAGGKDPESSLALATDGAFYGTAYQGGMNNGGTIYRIMQNGGFSDVYIFDGDSGCCPLATPIQHTNGVLYGDTYAGGTNNLGVFYSLIGKLPAFVSLLPYAGKAGATIQFLGQGFTGATKVSFNGVPAKFKVVRDTFLGAIVPGGAETGVVTVTTPSGVLTSNKKFLVIP